MSYNDKYWAVNTKKKSGGANVQYRAHTENKEISFSAMTSVNSRISAKNVAKLINWKE